MALTARQRQMLAEVRREFTAFARDFSALATSRSTLAPKFMRAFALWAGEQTDGATFIGYVRYLDPHVPAERDAYRVHRSYMAADYLRRLTTIRRTRRPIRSRLDMLARTLATIVPLVRDEAILWQAVEAELGMSARQITRLRAVVAAAQPLLTLPGVRQIAARIVHVPPAAAAA